MVNVVNGRLEEYLQYHKVSYDAQDIDPSYPMLRYVCDRFELNMEQRYWLAFLYATCYCGSTVYYMYNEFPDLAGVDLGRMERWWQAHRQQLYFQTDCRWIRSRNQFVEVVAGYRHLLQLEGGPDATHLQQQVWEVVAGLRADCTPTESYDFCYEFFSAVPYFGRFRMFLLLEAVHVMTGLPLEPTGLPLREAQSSRNGLCFAFGKDHLLRGNDYGDRPLTDEEYQELGVNYDELIATMKQTWPNDRVNAWNVETTLCAYKKWHRGKRYPGFYIDRQHDEILKMQKAVPQGVAWRVLWEFREATYPLSLRQELTGRTNEGLLWPRRW